MEYSYLKDLTILIKTFKRPKALEILLESIKKYYPDIPIIVVDDSSENSEFGFDIGLSRGRNELVKKCKTKYCAIIEDDCRFTEKTDLDKILKELIDRDLDILQFKIDTAYYGLYEKDDDGVKYVKASRDGLYDFCSNIFVAKTDTLGEYPWDEELKMGEHFAYFYEHQGKLKIGISDVEILHCHIDNQDYQPYRSRAVRYVKQYLVKKGLSHIRDLEGHVYITNEMHEI